MRATQILNSARNFIGEHKPTVALVALALAFVLYQFAGGVISGVRGALTSAQVSQTEAQANAEKAQAATAINEANDASVDRRIEDGIRERTIKPEIERTALVVNRSRSRTREAQTNYENSQNPALRSRLDDRALHGRNCADLANLFPGERFSRCE